MAAITIPSDPRRVDRTTNPVRVLQFLAAAAITKGQAVYLSSAGTVDLADADVAASAEAIGIALNTAAAGAVVDVLVYGELDGFTGLTIGGQVYVHTTAGSYTQAFNGGAVANGDLAAGDYAVVLGRALTASKILVSPEARLGAVLGA